jgi:hypothetical protein
VADGTGSIRAMRDALKGAPTLSHRCELPFAENATPATYEVKGRQFVMIAAGGGKDPESGSGGVYVAFALAGDPAGGDSHSESKH